jgi:predicted metal-dependent HD superfamily phosphohydrolase|tara:strand:- start:373 stop:642 length:270 start_codon:yes stop_codon:yes gene_type:complete
MDARIPETLEEKAQNLIDEDRMKLAQRYARMLAKHGRAEEELAIYIEYAWVETPEYMRDDLRLLDKWWEKSKIINAEIGAWARNRYGKR